MFSVNDGINNYHNLITLLKKKFICIPIITFLSIIDILFNLEIHCLVLFYSTKNRSKHLHALVVFPSNGNNSLVLKQYKYNVCVRTFNLYNFSDRL